MTIQGAIFHNPKFKFYDGEIGNKLLVLLNTPSQNESCLFVKTTTKKKISPQLWGVLNIVMKECSLYRKQRPLFQIIHGFYCLSLMKLTNAILLKKMGGMKLVVLMKRY